MTTGTNATAVAGTTGTDTLPSTGGTMAGKARSGAGGNGTDASRAGAIAVGGDAWDDVTNGVLATAGGTGMAAGTVAAAAGIPRPEGSADPSDDNSGAVTAARAGRGTSLIRNGVAIIGDAAGAGESAEHGAW